MQIKNIRKDLIKKTLIISAMLLVIAISGYYFYSQLQVMRDKKALLTTSINSINKKLDSLNNKTVRFSEAVKAWDELSEDRKALKGLQISKMQSLVSELKDKYKIVDLDFSFSKPTEAQGDLSYGTAVVFVSDVNIVFKAINDEYVYNFIDQLIKKSQGF